MITKPLQTDEQVVGTLEVSHDENYLYVDYRLDEEIEWSLKETHLHPGDVEDILNPAGRPRPGHAKYKTEHEVEADVRAVEHDIALADTDLEGVIDIAAHAELSYIEEEENEDGEIETYVVTESAWGYEADEDDEDEEVQLQAGPPDHAGPGDDKGGGPPEGRGPGGGDRGPGGRGGGPPEGKGPDPFEKYFEYDLS